MDSVNTNTNVIELRSLTKGKRMLLHLADLFVNFFIAMFLFSVLVFPVGKMISGYDSLTDSTNAIRKEMVSSLEENHLLDSQNQEDDFTTALKYSAKMFCVGFLTGVDTYDYPKTYFVSILGKTEKELKEVYQQCDSVGYFSFEDKIALKDKYVSEFTPILDEKDTLSAQGDEDYTNFTNVFFPSIYSLIITDLETNTSFPIASLASYRTKYEKIQQNIAVQNTIIFLCSFIGYFLSCLFYFLLFPMLNHRGRTLSMVAMKIERLGKDNLRILKRSERLLQFVFYVAFHMGLSLFLPMMFVDFASLFSITGLLTLSIIGLTLDVISFFFVMFSTYHQGLSDMLTKTVYITSDDFEKVMALKTYKVAK